MGKKHSVLITNKGLGFTLLIGLIIQFILPRIGITMLSGLSILIYLVVAFYLIIFG